MPRHINPTSQERLANAPYNFVPLPERIFTVADGIEVNGKKISPWEMHDQFVPGTHSGWIDVTIETLTPLYIRSAVRSDGDGNWDDRDTRLRPEPYTRSDGTPAIPGSSLRGMVRSLVEILSFSKIEPVTEAQPFFRTVADDRIGRAYRARMVRAGQKPQGGILRFDGSEASIEPREVVRVKRERLRGIQFNPRNPNYTPPWPQQHGPCWVKLGGGSDAVEAISVGGDCPAGTGWRRGTLVLTGNAPNKKREFVFLDPDGPTPDEVVVPEPIWTRFHDEDQITQWQERAFPRNQPRGTRRRGAGHLRDGEPVFFLTDSERVCEENPAGLVFLGRAGMFRFPYDRSPADLVPTALSTASLDLAEAMFGKVDRHATIKGRVRVEDAVATAGGPDWLESILVPQILSAPKPTTFQHYLTQDGQRGKEQLTTYLEGDHTTIRGHKVYWHRWGPEELAGVRIDHVVVREQGREVKKAHDEVRTELQGPDAKEKHTQHTILQPVKAGVTFRGRVRFENLTDLELGALLEALQLPDGCCHRLGMGKPLGLGSVRIASRLQLVDRAARYGAWQASDVQENEDGSRFRSAFEAAMLRHARASNETLLANRQGLRQVGRLNALYQILTWSSRPAPGATGYMDLTRFRQRPVLPTPHAVAGSDEPAWRNDPPRPGSSPGEHLGSLNAPREMGRDQRPVAAPSRAPAVKPVEKGQTRSGVLKRRDDGWVAIFEGDPRDGQIVNPRAIPGDCVDGTPAEFFITEQSKPGGIKARFNRIQE
jgi:CRISPR-associated protein (TIGR03986 family)